VAEPTLYLVDGYNLLRAGDFAGRDELVDLLAGFVALHGARGVVVFDGVGDEHEVGPLSVRFADHADALLEQIAAERRGTERVLLVSSDRAVRETSGQEVAHRSSRSFAQELGADTASPGPPEPAGGGRIEDALDEDTRTRLERWRRGVS
jgi:predicted RNA-binding protein with PIN domain